MNIKAYTLFILMSTGISLSAEPILYGKFFITAESQDTVSGTEVDLVSNGSLLGLKGSMDLDDGLEAIYQIEYEIDPVDGTADEPKERTLKQRNSFVGLKGSFGTFFLGNHDTALKQSQAKVDLFNNLIASDISNILHGENRMTDFVGYTTPKSNAGLSVTFNAIKGTETGNNSLGDSTSISLNYRTKSFYAAISIDSELKGYDTTRFTLQIPLKRTQLGFIFQDTKEIITGTDEGGYVISLSHKIGEKGTLKYQITESDMKVSSGKQTTIGYDFQLSKKTKAFFFLTDLSGDNNSKEKQKEIGAIGFDFKF